MSKFCFQLFSIAELEGKVIDIVADKGYEPFCTQVHRKYPHVNNFFLHVLTVVFFIVSLFTRLFDDLYALSLDVVEVCYFYTCAVFEDVDGVFSVVAGGCGELVDDFRLALLVCRTVAFGRFFGQFLFRFHV